MSPIVLGLIAVGGYLALRGSPAPSTPPVALQPSVGTPGNIANADRAFRLAQQDLDAENSGGYATREMAQVASDAIFGPGEGSTRVRGGLWIPTRMDKNLYTLMGFERIR